MLALEFYKCCSAVCILFALECANGTFGAGCRYGCRCGENGLCDRVTGACVCGAGWVGRYCDQPCPEGFYGPSCSEICSCESPARCHHVSGKCLCAAGTMSKGCKQRCSEGFWGIDCKQVSA